MIENYLTVEELEIIVKSLEFAQASHVYVFDVNRAKDEEALETLADSTLPCIKKALERAREDRASLKNDPNFEDKWPEPHFKQRPLLTKRPPFSYDEDERPRRNAYDPNDRHNPNHPNPRRDA